MTPAHVATLLLAALALLFVVQNVGVVEIKFLLWSFSMSRSLLIFAVLAIGVAIGWSWHSLVSHRRRKEPQ